MGSNRKLYEDLNIFGYLPSEKLSSKAIAAQKSNEK